MNLPNGHLLQKGKYRITHVVGQGGFGITYKGVWFTEVKGSLGTVKTEVPIAIKEYFFKNYCYREEESYAVKVHSETGNSIFHKFKEKLIAEARILSEVHHPNIVNVLEVFEENNTAYIAMEYISGLSLKEMMEREGHLSENKVLKYIHQIGDALQFIHDNNILHLDIKPSNILIDRRDNARLIDFGVSKRYDTVQEETSTEMLTLSKGFASIEQYDNEGIQNFTPYPDIYSLGATMYNLLTGKIPTESILRATRPLAKPSELNPNISSKTETVICKAMEVVAENRFNTVQEMLDALDKPVEEINEIITKHPQNISIGGDTTLIFNSTAHTTEPSSLDEQTILNQDVPVLQPKKKNKRLYLILSFVGMAIVASAISIVFLQPFTKNNNVADSKMNSTTLPDENVTIPDNHNTIILSEENQNDETSETSEIPIETNPAIPVQEGNSNQTKPSETVSQNIVNEVNNNRNPNSETIHTEPVINASDLEIQYAAFVNAGNEKMVQTDYEGAKNDFRKAYDINPNDELWNKMFEAENKAREKEILERKSLYEQMMPFGDLIVVRKLSTDRYGAIDENGIERIPCKYLLSDNIEDGRAFQREDGLFDIYNRMGTILREGVTL